MRRVVLIVLVLAFTACDSQQQPLERLDGYLSGLSEMSDCYEVIRDQTRTGTTYVLLEGVSYRLENAFLFCAYSSSARLASFGGRRALCNNQRLCAPIVDERKAGQS